MSDNELGLDEILETLGGIANITVDKRQEITQKAAEALKDDLSEATKDKHYRNHKTGKVEKPHLSDSVVIGKLEGGMPVGDTAVGFENKTKSAAIARWLNDGTKYIKGDDFYDKTINASGDKVTQIMIDELDKLLDGDK